jgi:hypothetical protein
MENPGRAGNERLTALTALPGSLPGSLRAPGAHLSPLMVSDIHDRKRHCFCHVSSAYWLVNT